MSDSAWAAVYVILGAALQPLFAGVSAIVRRRWNRADGARQERRDAAYALLDALVHWSTEKIATRQVRNEEPEETREGEARMREATRRVQASAVRLGDEQIWKLVTSRDLDVDAINAVLLNVLAD